MSELSDLPGSGAEGEAQDTDIIYSSSSDVEKVDNDKIINQPSLPGHLQKRRKGRPQKHARSDTRTAHWEWLQQFYNDKYLELLNEDRPSADSLMEKEAVDFFSRTQHGIVLWEPREKAAFFDALSKKGRHDVKAIADAVETKSEIEIVAYLKLLQDRAAGQHLYKDDTRAPALADIPAAAEISQVTEGMLDKNAEALNLYQDNVDMLLGQQRHPDNWIIDMNKALSLEESVETSNEPELPILEAELFRVSTWLELSQNVFMNSAHPNPEDNWRNIAFEDESPALTLDALAAFHELAIGITRRLVQTSLILAKSRLRATRDRNPAPTVREIDVSAALNILNMAPNTWTFWHKAPRRCHLSVKYAKQPKGKSARVDYDEIERVLYEKTFNRKRGRSTSTASNMAGSETSTHSGTDDEADTMAPGAPEETSIPVERQSEYSDDHMTDQEGDISDLDGEREPEESEGGSETDATEDHLYFHKYSTSRDVRQRRLELQHHLIADQVDKANGQSEEARLWRLLGRNMPDNVARNPTPPPRRGPRSLRKSRYELTDWKDAVLGKTGWDEYTHGRSDNISSLRAAKRQRRSLSESGDSSHASSVG